MLVLDDLTNIVNQMGIYRMALVAKSIFSVVFIVVPLIVIILSIIDISKAIFKPDGLKDSIKKPVNRIITGLVIFLLPSVIEYCFTLIDNYDNSSIIAYYNDASIEKINELEEEYKVQKAAADAKEAAMRQEELLKQEEERRKRNEQMEEFRQTLDDAWNPPTSSSGNYSGDSVSSGSYGSVTVENGVFYIPNQRATSDADIPKQSGQYGLNPIFWERLSALLSDAQANGYNVTVTSGWRSYSSQRSLWDNSNRSCSERSKWVACPGGSRHGFGIAADLSFNGTSCSGGWDCNAAATWVHANAANYGLTFRMSWEPWHIEPAQVSGGNFGSCTATC